MPPQLPPEVLDLILAEVGADWLSGDCLKYLDAALARTALSRCCRVSRVFLDLSRRLLYSVIVLQFIPSSGPAFTQTSDSIAHSFALARRPTLAQHARSLVIDASSNWDDTYLDDNLIPLAILNTLRVATGVCDIYLNLDFTDRDSYADQILVTLGEISPLLKRLRIRSHQDLDPFRPAAMAALLHALPLLQSLELYPPYDIEDVHPPKFRLQSLKLGPRTLLRLDPLPFLTTYSHETLTHLHLHTSRGETPYNLSPFVSLHAVTISCHTSEQDFNLLDTLRAPLLESVTLDVQSPHRQHPGGLDDHIDRRLIKGALERLPKMAKVVKLAAFVDNASLDAFLVNTSDLGWRRLELLVKQTRQGSFREACDAQGIVLKFNQK